MGARKIRSSVVVGVVGAIAVVGLSITPGVPAHADPTLNAAAPFALSILPSVEYAAADGQTALDQAQYADLLASQNTYSPTWDTIVSTYGTAAPVSPSPTDAATIESLEKEFGATATEAGEFGAGGLAVASALIGVRVGAALSSTFGIDTDGGLCAPAPTAGFDTADTVLAALTGTDCKKWKTTSGFNAQANHDQTPMANSSAIGSTSCDDEGRCGVIYAISSGGDYYCAEQTDGGDMSGGFPPVVVGQVIDFGVDGQAYLGGYYWEDSPNHGGGCPDGSTMPTNRLNVSAFGGYPLVAWALYPNMFNRSEQTSLPSPIYANPTRVLKCEIEWVGGGSASEETDTFTETDGDTPKPKCPAIPAGQVPASITIYVVTGSTETPWLTEPTTTTYQDWKTTYPECGNGSCLLDLRHGSGSCFWSSEDCDGWISDPTRADDYTCTYGTHTVDLSNCFIYGAVYSSTNRASGHAYSDPTTGADISGQTSATQDDVLKQRCVNQLKKPFGSSTWGQTAGVTWDECETLPVFFGGHDTEEPTAHDLAVLEVNPALLVLHYESAAEKGVSRPLAPTSICPNPRPTGQECDEFPFFSTSEGYPTMNPPDWALVNGEQNGDQGNFLRTFYSASSGCNLKIGSVNSDARKFLIVPDPEEATAPFTTWHCP